MMHTMLYIYSCNTTAPLYNVIIIFDMVVMQKRNFKHEKYEFVSVAILRLSQHHQGFCAARIHTSTIGNVKIARSEILIVLLLHPHADVSYSLVVT